MEKLSENLKIFYENDKEIGAQIWKTSEKVEENLGRTALEHEWKENW